MDIVSDTLTRMKNAVMREKDTVEVQKSKLVMEVLRVLKEEAFIRNVTEDEGKVIVELAYYEDGEPVVQNFEKVSKQGQRVYVNSKELIPVMNGRGIGIISTSKGVMTVASAKSKSLGGEYICKVW